MALHEGLVFNSGTEVWMS